MKTIEELHEIHNLGEYDYEDTDKAPKTVNKISEALSKTGKMQVIIFDELG